MGNLIFVSYAREDRERVRPLVVLLDRRLRETGASIFWDQDLQPGVAITNEIYKLLSEAACVLVVWTQNSVSSEWVHAECEGARRDGRLVPVRLDREAEIRPPFNIKNTIELADWKGGETPDFQRLFACIHDLAIRGAGAAPYTLDDNPWVVETATNASVGLHRLTTRFRSIQEVLLADSPAIGDLEAALKEVMNTFKVVSEAVKAFIRPALRDSLVADPYLDMAYGDLPQVIETGRGHCGRILVHYKRFGGVRDEILGRLDDAQIDELDETFEELGTADGDAFAQMTNIGDYLKNESKAIVNLLLSRRQDDARERIIRAREMLEPLEQKLSDAMVEMQQLQSSLGVLPEQRDGRGGE